MQSTHSKRVLFVLLLLVTQPLLAKTTNDVLSANTARKFATHLQGKDYPSLDRLFNIQGVCDNITALLYDNPIQRKMFDLRECSTYKRLSFSELILRGVHSLDFSSKYIGKSRAGMHTVRLTYSEGGIEFIELFFDPEDASKVVDLYLATRGQRISRGIADNIALMANGDSSIIKKMLGINEISKETSSKLMKISKSLKAGEFRTVLTLIDSLPEELRQSKNFLAMKVTVSSSLDEATYYAALEQLDRHHGDDSALTMLLLDYYIYEDDIEMLDQAFLKLKSRYIDDAGLNNIEANLQSLRGETQKAMLLIERCIDKEPLLFDCQYTKLYLLIAQDRLEEAKATLNYLQDNFDAKMIDTMLAKDPSLADL